METSNRVTKQNTPQIGAYRVVIIGRPNDMIRKHPARRAPEADLAYLSETITSNCERPYFAIRRLLPTTPLFNNRSMGGASFSIRPPPTPTPVGLRWPDSIFPSRRRNSLRIPA